jgi:hypothetical protein
MERESDMTLKYIVTENFKSTEKDRKSSFLSKLAKIINSSVKYPTEKK